MRCWLSVGNLFVSDFCALPPLRSARAAAAAKARSVPIADGQPGQKPVVRMCGTQTVVSDRDENASVLSADRNIEAVYSRTGQEKSNNQTLIE